MKLFLFVLLSLALLLTGCNINEQSETSLPSVSEQTSVDETSIIEEISADMTNQNYTNPGKMGDSDGPACVIYSKTGYNRASMTVDLQSVALNNVRKNDKKFVNAYIFLGMDIYGADTGWVNCLDSGLCYSGRNGYWHIFYNMYSTLTNANTWYESSVKLPSDDSYTLYLDSSKEDGKVTLTVKGVNNGVTDSVTFEAAYAMKDGSNTSYLMNFALDYPDDVKKDTSGNPSEDFAQITLYNTNQGIYMKNLIVSDACLNDTPWTSDKTETIGLWPDAQMPVVSYKVTQVDIIKADTDFRIDFDMNIQ